MNDWSVLIALSVFLIGIGGLVLYVWTLVNAAKNGKWVWFVLILLLWPFCVLYLLFADKSPPDQRPTVKGEPMRRDPTM